MPMEEQPNTSRNAEEETSEVSVAPSREQQWREIIDNPAPALPAMDVPDEMLNFPESLDSIEYDYTPLHRWVLITALTILLILMGQGVAGDSTPIGDIDKVLQR